MSQAYQRYLVAVGALALAVSASGSADASSRVEKMRSASTTQSIPAKPVEAKAAPDLATVPIAQILADADRPVAEALRYLLATRIAGLISREADRTGVETFYRDRGFAPLWIENGAPAPRAGETMAFLKAVAADGLDPADYPAPALQGADAASLAEAEIKLTNSVLTFARHARTGRVHFTRVSEAAAFDLKFPNPAEVLGQIAASANVRQTLDAYHPPHPEYRALKAKLLELRGRGDARPARIANGPVLKFEAGKKGREKVVQDPRVPMLRDRLGLPAAADTRYDKALADAVKAFQNSRGVKPDGQLTAATVEALNGAGNEKRIDSVLANMERWRWVPRDLGTAHVIVNIPDYSLRVMNDQKLAWSTRVVVGKPGEQATPLLSETMKFITVNPTWNVPPSIIKNEYLPALQRDPGALSRIGLKTKRKKDGTLHVYQPPGPKNALGQIRFNFPNPFLVYQHDTPAKHLFAKSERAFSHGCIRVQHPEKYAEVLLSITQAKDGYTAERVKNMFGENERTINLKSPMVVHLTYQTAFVDDAGRLQLRKDIYGRDARLLAVLRDERAVADVPVGRTQSAGNQPVLARSTSR